MKRLVEWIPTPAEARSVLARLTRERELLRGLLRLSEKKEAAEVNPQTADSLTLVRSVVAAIHSGDTSVARVLLKTLHEEHGIALSLGDDLEGEVPHDA